MNRMLRRSVTLLIILAMLCLTAFGCALTSPVPLADPEGYQSPYAAAEGTIDAQAGAIVESDAFLSVKDMSGRIVSFDAYPERIVVLDAADCEILYALGAEGLIVGRGVYCSYPASVYDKEAISTASETNIDEIKALEPQLVVMSADAKETAHVEALESAGIRVVMTNATIIAEVYDAVNLLGAVTGKSQEASALVVEMVSKLAAVAAKAPADSAKTVYFELSPLASGLQTGGSGTLMDELARMLNVHNEFEDLEGVQEITETQVIGRNPDYIVTLSATAPDGSDSIEEISARRDWDALQAVQNGKVFYIPRELFTRAGPRLVDAIEALYEALYVEPESDEAGGVG